VGCQGKEVAAVGLTEVNWLSGVPHTNYGHQGTFLIQAATPKKKKKKRNGNTWEREKATGSQNGRGQYASLLATGRKGKKRE